MEKAVKTQNLNEKRHELYTRGPILRALFILAVPIIIGNFLQTAYQITDIFWVGSLGKEAVAAVSICFPIIFLIMTFSGGIGLAGGVLVSQYKGRQEHKKVDFISGQTLFLAFVISLFSSILGYIFAPQIMGIFGTEEIVFYNALSYIRVSFLGMVFVFGYMVYQSLSRAVGETKAPVFIIFATVLLNFFLDPLFIYGWKFFPAMGVAGAATATLITQMIALIVGMVILLRGKTGIHLKLEYFKPNFEQIKKIMFLGVPISLEQSSRAVGFILINLIVASFGTIALASYGIGSQMISLIIIPALSIAIANSTLVGHNIGAGKIKRAEQVVKISVAFGFVLLTAVGILFFIFANNIVSIFINSKDIEVIKEGALFLRIVSLSFGFIAVQMSILGSLRGAGNVKSTFFIASSTVAFQVVSAFLISKYFLKNQIGVWYAFPLSNIFGALLAYFVFFRGKWKEKEVLDSPEVKEEIEKESSLAEC
jgi:putative MATE family efflux protein